MTWNEGPYKRRKPQDRAPPLHFQAQRAACLERCRPGQLNTETRREAYLSAEQGRS